MYAVVIIGIFVIQFKSESIFSEAIGSFRFRLTKTENNQETILKNSFQAEFNGILFYFDDSNPVTIVKIPTNTVHDITLISWSKASALSSTFNFTEDVSLTFTVSDSSPEADLSIQAKLPKDVDSVSINFKPRKGFQVTDKKKSNAVLESTESKYLLTSSDTANEKVTISRSTSISYSAVKETTGFSFDAAASYALASSEIYAQNIKALETNILNLFREAVKNNTTITEQSVVAYVAVMAKNGQYNNALDSVPDSFKKNQKRTYLSAPYFNNLSKTYTTLEMHNESMLMLAKQAVEQNNCSVFAVSGISDFLRLNEGEETAEKLLNILSNTEIPELSVQQASGILNVYTSLLDSGREVKINRALIDACLGIIENSCSIRDDGQKVILASSNEGQPKPVQAIETGIALVRYAKKINAQNLEKAGYFIVNSYFSDISSNDLYSFSEIYPLLIKNNTYYPHFEIIGKFHGKSVWAWTCASKLSCTENSSGNLDVNIEFPKALTHYIIIGGIPAFNKINIYGIPFRTDARFETYNSSGYVHLKNSQTLLLKSRHRSETEKIQLFYSEENKSAADASAEDKTQSE